MISCTLSDIPNPVTNILWSPETVNVTGYHLTDGAFNPTTHSQVASLRISGAKIIELRNSKAHHVFTCKITVGSNSTTVSAIKTITIFNPSKKN